MKTANGQYRQTQRSESDIPTVHVRTNSRTRLRKKHRQQILQVRILQTALCLTLIALSIVAVKKLTGNRQRSSGSLSSATQEQVIQADSTGRKTQAASAPVISGVRPIVCYAGDAVSYRAGITVSGDDDAEPALELDTTKVDLSKVGKYPIVYTARDKWGNTSQQETTVEVRERKEGYVSADLVTEKADQLIGQIIHKGMSQREQVEAIYAWLRGNCRYSGHSDKSDYLQAAYKMLTEYSGDCYNYFAASKLLFDRLGIDNIDVKKVKNHPDDSNHYWSMVSLDGKKTWYHFDATPRVGNGDDFCLVTDAFLDAYSNTHDKCHNRDKSLYPATPES